MIHYIFVEGGIGVGKTTFIHRVAEVLRDVHLMHVIVVPEPIEAWQNAKGHNLLEAFYKDKSRWACTFQSHALATRVKAVRAAIEAYQFDSDIFDLYVLCERSVYTDRHVFVETLLADNMMTPMEAAVYEQWWNFITPMAYPGKIIGVVYLRASAELCSERIKLRDRTEEASVALDYLERLNAKHDMAIASDDTWNGAPKLIFEADKLGDIVRDDVAVSACAERMHRFIIEI